MLITPTDLGFDLAANLPGYHRSAGLHMSDIYNDLYKDLEPDRFDRRDKDGNPLPFNKTLLEMGMATEGMLEYGLKDRLPFERPAEMRTRHAADCALRRTEIPEGKTCPCGGGIYYSPDGLLYQDHIPGGVRLVELKATGMSCRYLPIKPEWIGTLLPLDYKEGPSFPPKFDKYFTQIMAYAFHLDTCYARLIVFFREGDYSRPFTSVILPWDFIFTAQELQSNWAMLLRHARSKDML